MAAVVRNLKELDLAAIELHQVQQVDSLAQCRSTRISREEPLLLTGVY